MQTIMNYKNQLNFIYSVCDAHMHCVLIQVKSFSVTVPYKNINCMSSYYYDNHNLG